MENQELNELFSRYINKKASPEEVILLLGHFHLESDSAILMDAIIKEINNTANDDNVINLHEHAVYDRVESALSLRIDQEKGKSFWQKRGYRIAISVAATLLLVSGYILWNNSRPEVMLTAYAPYGKTTEIRLSDSSKITLSAGTTIIYPEKFKSGIRSVTIKDGDALFAVEHDEHKPFIVKSNGINVTVLGTSFEVNAFGKDTHIAVKSGKVGVLQPATNKAVTFLLSGQGVIINQATHELRQIKVDTADIGAWRNNRLIFDNQPLGEVMQSLERTYNVHITIANPELLNEKISMRPNNQPLSDILTAISFSNHLTYKIVNDQSVIVK